MFASVRKRSKMLHRERERERKKKKKKKQCSHNVRTLHGEMIMINDWREIKELASMKIPELDELTIIEVETLKENACDTIDLICYAYCYGYQRHRIATEKKILELFARFL